MMDLNLITLIYNEIQCIKMRDFIDILLLQFNSILYVKIIIIVIKIIHLKKIIYFGKFSEKNKKNTQSTTRAHLLQ